MGFKQHINVKEGVRVSVFEYLLSKTASAMVRIRYFITLFAGIVWEKWNTPASANGRFILLYKERLTCKQVQTFLHQAICQLNLHNILFPLFLELCERIHLFFNQSAITAMIRFTMALTFFVVGVKSIMVGVS